MEFTINGFSQAKLIEYGLDSDSSLILRWFVDYYATGKMVKRNIDDEMYVWIKYDDILRDLPILNFKKDAVYRRLQIMVDKNILKHQNIKEKGSYSFYTIGPAYLSLIESDTLSFLNTVQKTNTLITNKTINKKEAK